MFTLLHGTYHVVGHSPDADSIKFKAKNAAHWDKIETDNRKRFESELKEEDGMVQVRLQAIDALETHYSPPNLPTPRGLGSKIKKLQKDEKPQKGNHKQPIHFGEQATNTFLEFLGVTDVKWRKFGRASWIDSANINGTVIEDKYADAIPGYLIADDIERNGRPLGWVFTGEPPAADGAQLSKQQVGELVGASANFDLIKRGTVYPFFYMSVPGAIRIPLREAAMAAQQNPDENAVWAHDHTVQGVEVPSLHLLYEETVVYPYLFRRIVRQWYSKTMQRFWDHVSGKNTAHYVATDDDLGLDLDGFFEDGDPWIFLIGDQDFVHLSEVLDVTRTSLKLHVYPYDIVFLS